VVEAVGKAKFFFQGMAHGVSQGLLSVMQGGDFLSGAAGGFFGSLGASGFKAFAGAKFAASTGGTIAFGALSGGVGAELSGGNFWQGAIAGGIVAGLNHAMHEIDPPRGYKGNKWVDETGTYYNNHDGSWSAIDSNGENFYYTDIEEVIITKRSTPLLVTGISAFGIANGAKTSLIEYAGKNGGLSKGVGNYLKFFKRAGIIGAGLTTSYSLYNTGVYYYNGGDDWQVGVKAGLDIIMTGVGFLGPIGFGISATYFILDYATDGFGGWQVVSHKLCKLKSYSEKF